jgi:hypothetical protein
MEESYVCTEDFVPLAIAMENDSQVRLTKQEASEFIQPKFITHPTDI